MLFCLGVKNDLAFFLKFFDVGVVAQFINGAYRRGTHLEGYPLAGFRHKKTLRLQVRVETALRFAVGVRYVVARDRPFSRQITNFRHDSFYLCDGA